MSSEDIKENKQSADAKETTEDIKQEVPPSAKDDKPAASTTIGTVGKVYPTRCQYVGEMLALFCSCYRRGTFPICSIGPSWPFTFVLLLFAVFCLGFMGFMLSVLYKQDSFCK